MTYASLRLTKYYLGVETADDDTLIKLLMDKAQADFERDSQRTFQGAAATRKYDAVMDVQGDTLWLGADLLSVTSIINGNGSAIASTSYVLLPTNESPKYAIKIKSSSGASWDYDESHEEAISVTGSWGYMTSPSGDVILAFLEYTKYLYHQRSQTNFQRTAMPELGIIISEGEWPPEYRRAVEYYRPKMPRK